jgi:hypothetical protein
LKEFAIRRALFEIGFVDRVGVGVGGTGGIYVIPVENGDSEPSRIDVIVNVSPY